MCKQCVDSDIFIGENPSGIGGLDRRELVVTLEEFAEYELKIGAECLKLCCACFYEGCVYQWSVANCKNLSGFH